MGRKDVCCDMRHTPLSPHKNRIRRDWMKGVLRSKDLITISHGLCDVAMLMEWGGQIQICDIDPGVRETTSYLAGMDGQQGDYPDLRLLEPGHDILSTVLVYCDRYGVQNLGAVDVDLACGVKAAWDILRPVLGVLKNRKYCGKVLLTFRNGRNDGFKSIDSRIRWLKNQLRGRAQLFSYERYNSGRINEDASRYRGSPMCIVELWVGKQGMRKAA